MEKTITTDILLTKEAFAKYANDLREKTAKEHGMTLEEWDYSILTHQTINQPSGSNIYV